MSSKNIIFLLLLTGIYLCFELAFNARLLDVVSGTATIEQIHNIEIYGRSLSGVAVALVCLQILLSKRFGIPLILLGCFISAGITYIALQSLVENLITYSTPEFRRLSKNIVLIQRAMVNGGIELDGLKDDPSLFTSAEGKAFLAVFSAMAVSVENLDEKISETKIELIGREIDSLIGGPGGYHKKYLNAIRETKDQWKRYSQALSENDISIESKHRQDKAWNDYLADLDKRGWTPSTIPMYARSSVVKKVRAQIPVSARWIPSDEQAFRSAVNLKVHKNAGDGTVIFKGEKIPAGLSYLDFFYHKVIQNELHEQLKLPSSVTLKHNYDIAEEFKNQVYNPMRRAASHRKLLEFDGSAITYANKGINHAEGLKAARAVIVPPIALLFSLLGAIGHISKFCYLLVKLFSIKIPSSGNYLKFPSLIPISLLLTLITSLIVINNEITNSRIYTYLQRQIEIENSNNWYGPLIVNGFHVVTVGQGYSYPFNEFIRLKFLGGIEYGYESAH